MIQRLGQVFRLRPGETGLVLTLGFLLFANSVAQPLAEITAVSNFLTQVGVNDILFIWMLDAGLALLITGAQSLIIDRFDRRKLLQVLCAVLALTFATLSILFIVQAPDWLNYGLLYLVAQQQWLFFPLVFWILASDLLDMPQSQRLFPLIASLGFAGRLIGILLALVFPGLALRFNLGTVSVLLFCSTIYVTSLVVAFIGLRRARIRTRVYKVEPVGATLTEGWEFVRHVPVFRFLAIILVAMIFCETFLEFHFLTVSEQVFSDPVSYQSFYSLYRLGVTVASMAVQAFLASRIISRIGLKNTFLILPICALAGSLWMLAMVSSIVAAVGGVVLQKLPQFTVDETARKQFQALVPEERRGRVSIFMDSYLFVAGSLGGCLITAVIVFAGLRLGLTNYAYGYLAAAVVASIIGIWAALRLRSIYDTGLLNWRLRRRGRGASVLDKLDF